MVILAWGSMLLGFLVTVVLVAWNIHAYDVFLQTQNVSVDEMKAKTELITQRLGFAFLPSFIGLVCGLAGIVLLVLQSRRTPPPAKHPPQERG